MTAAQMAVLSRLGAGWELGVYGGIDSFAVLRNGGIGRGGEVQRVHWNTIYALRDNGWVSSGKKEGFPVTLYTLTEAGVAAMREALGAGQSRSSS